MERVGVDVAAHRYVQRAIQRTGSADKLGALLEPELGHRYSREQVSRWTRDGRVPGPVLLAIQRVTSLSLDQAANGLVHGDLDDEVAQLRADVDALLAERREVRARLGLPDHVARDENVPDDIPS